MDQRDQTRKNKTGRDGRAMVHSRQIRDAVRIALLLGGRDCDGECNRLEPELLNTRIVSPAEIAEMWYGQYSWPQSHCSRYSTIPT